MTDTTTTLDERCERTELLVSQCAHCHPNPEGEKIAKALGAFGPDSTEEFDSPAVADGVPFGKVGIPFKAHYSGTCWSCSMSISVGESIQQTADGRYSHTVCS